MLSSSRGAVRIPFRRAVPGLAAAGVQLSDALPLAGGIANAGIGGKASRDDHVHPQATAGTYFWISPHTLIATPGNPTANPWAFFLKIWLPFPQPLHGYLYTLTRTGIKTDGELRLGIWTNSDATGEDLPGAEYVAGRVLALHDKQPAGLVHNPLQSRGITFLTLAAGYSWIHCCIAEGMGHLTPPVGWADGGDWGKGFSHAFSVHGMAGWVSGTFDPANDLPQQKVPMIGIY